MGTGIIPIFQMRWRYRGRKHLVYSHMVELRFDLRQPSNKPSKMFGLTNSLLDTSLKEMVMVQDPLSGVPLYMDFKSAQEERGAVSLSAPHWGTPT